MTKEIIQSKINEVSNSFPSLFSKEDVIKVLTSLGEELESQPQKGPGFDFEAFKTDFLRRFEDNLNMGRSSELVDFDSAQFTLNYSNCIELDDIEIQVDSIRDIAESTFDEIKPEEEDDFLIDESLVNSEN